MLVPTPTMAEQEKLLIPVLLVRADTIKGKKKVEDKKEARER